MTLSEKAAALLRLPMPDGMERMPSGAVQFGDDWPGYFLRGDNAMTLFLGRSLVLELLATGDTRPSTLMWAESSLSWIEAMGACIMTDDIEKQGPSPAPVQDTIEAIADIIARWDEHHSRLFDEAVAKARQKQKGQS